MIDEDARYKRCISRFATGVAVVTASRANGEIYGVTVNSLLSISMSPRLVGWTLQTGKPAAKFFSECSFFRVHILSARQGALAQRFAGPPPRRFEEMRPATDPWGAPALEEPLAHLSCEVHSVHELGDHHLFVGRVLAHSDEDVLQAVESPLIYYQAKLGWQPERQDS